MSRTNRLLKTRCSNFLPVILPSISTWALCFALTEGLSLWSWGLLENLHNFPSGATNNRNRIIRDRTSIKIHPPTACFMVIKCHAIFKKKFFSLMTCGALVLTPVYDSPWLLLFWSMGSLENGIWRTLQFSPCTFIFDDMTTATPAQWHL